MVQFVLDLNDQYAPTLVKLQTNASFETAPLVHNGAAAAVHIFKAYFDSLLGPQFRYEVLGSTAYCGAKNKALPEAIQRSHDEPLELMLYSRDPPVEEAAVPELAPQLGGEGGNDDLWMGGIAAAIGRASSSQHSRGGCYLQLTPRPQPYQAHVTPVLSHSWSYP